MPVPSCVRDCASRDAVEALEQARQLVCRRCRCRCRRTDSSAPSPRQRSVDRDPPVERELERVREQVEDDLLPHLAVDVAAARAAASQSTDQLEPGLLDRRAEQAREIGGERGEIGRLVARLHAARLDAREVEQRVHQPQQPQAVAVRGRQPLAAARRQRASVAASSSSSGPSISVSGVRNSWLTLLKNAVLARSISASASARARSCSYASAFASALVTPWATRSKKPR